MHAVGMRPPCLRCRVGRAVRPHFAFVATCRVRQLLFPERPVKGWSPCAGLGCRCTSEAAETLSNTNYEVN